MSDLMLNLSERAAAAISGAFDTAYSEGQFGGDDQQWVLDQIGEKFPALKEKYRYLPWS